MAKISRYASTRIASTINARYHPDDAVVDSYFLDGRFASRRDSRAVDMTSVREDRGFFYALFAHPKEGDKASSDMPFAPGLEKLSREVKSGSQNIDEQINDLADIAVDVTGRATLSRNGVRQSWFSGILVKEGEIAAVTTGAGCALLYRGDVLYPLSESDFTIEPIDYNGNPVEGINDYAAGVAGTIRYSNIAQLKPNDCIILCNRELLEALGQRELLRLLFEADDQMEAAQQIMTAAAAKAPTVSMQVLLAFVEDVNTQSKTGRLNLGLFNTGSTPSQQEIKRAESRADRSHQPEDKKDSMNNYDDYNTNSLPPQDEPHYDTGTWKPQSQDQDAPFKPQESEFEQQPADPYYDDTYAPQDDYQGNDSYADDYTYDGGYNDGYQAGGGDYQDGYDDGYYNDQGYGDQGYGDQGYDDQGGYDDGYYDDGYYDDQGGDWTGDPSDDDYYDEYYDDYGDGGGGYNDGNRVKRIIMYAALLLVCLICVFILIRMLVKKNKEPEESSLDPHATSEQQVEIPEEKEKEQSTTTTQTLPVREEITAAPQEDNNFFLMTMYTDEGETPSQFLISVYGKDDESYFEFLKRFNNRMPDSITEPMAGGTAIQVPVAEEGPFRPLSSWFEDPNFKAEFDQKLEEHKAEQQEEPQEAETPETEFGEDEDTNTDTNTDETP